MYFNSYNFTITIAPLFVGMENLDYLKGDKKFDWTSFADNVIPFITDINAKNLVQ